MPSNDVEGREILFSGENLAAKLLEDGVSRAMSVFIPRCRSEEISWGREPISSDRPKIGELKMGPENLCYIASGNTIW